MPEVKHFKRICLLGGTFNPIHNGHLHIAKSVAALLNAELVLFIPSGIPPHKAAENIPSGLHRLAMLRLALSGYPQFEVCDIEINRAGPSFTIDTLDLLKARYPKTQLIFIVGMDAFIQIKAWKDPERLLTLCDFAIISRAAYPFSKLLEVSGLPLVDVGKLKALDRGDLSVYHMPLMTENTLHLLSISHCKISGTSIRKGLAAGESPRNTLPRSVESYIIKHKIYRRG